MTGQNNWHELVKSNILCKHSRELAFLGFVYKINIDENFTVRILQVMEKCRPNNTFAIIYDRV